MRAANRERLERLVHDRNTPPSVVWRALIALLAGDGLTTEAIAATVGISPLAVYRWRRLFAENMVDRLLLKDTTRTSRVKPLVPGKVKRVVHIALHETPLKATCWRMRSTAAAADIT